MVIRKHTNKTNKPINSKRTHACSYVNEHIALTYKATMKLLYALEVDHKIYAFIVETSIFEQ